MTPTLNDFTRALLTPDLSFATLADARAVTDRQGLPRLRRTTRFAEARIEWRGGSWLLFLPLAPQALLRIERTAARLRRLTSNLLASYRILPGEMQWCDTLGTPRTTDLILQELPAGAEFSTALETEEPATLLAALDTLQEGLRSLGFNHRNLKPGNLRWCAGRFIPLRYHDARFGTTGADDEAFEAPRTGWSSPRTSSGPTTSTRDAPRCRRPKGWASSTSRAAMSSRRTTKSWSTTPRRALASYAGQATGPASTTSDGSSPASHPLPSSARRSRRPMQGSPFPSDDAPGGEPAPQQVTNHKHQQPIENMEQVKVLIIGSGPAGYTAGIYTSRANLAPVLYEGIEPGGQLTTTTEIENFPGYPEGVDGNQMMADLRRQAERFGTDVRSGVVTRVDLSQRPFRVEVDGEKELRTETLIVSTGASAKYLGLPSETRFRGMGVSACATCDGFFYRKKDVAVVGGGDTACEEATYLASLCRKVYMIVRKPYLRASKAMQERVFHTPNIEVLFEHNTVEVLGDDNGVTGALLRHNDGTERRIDIDGFFLAIGHHPNTELFAGQLELDAEGYIRTEPGTSKTSVEGVFAAGDVQDPHYRQAITAAGSGCIAALDCERFLHQ